MWKSFELIFFPLKIGEMKEHKTFEVHPPNSEKNVKEMVEVNFNPIGEKMPDLLSEFIKLLGNEKEEWGGVAAMKACRNEFFKECPKLEDTVPTYKDLEEFLFSPNRYVPIFDQVCLIVWFCLISRVLELWLKSYLLISRLG